MSSAPSVSADSTYDCKTCGVHGLSTSNRSRHLKTAGHLLHLPESARAAGSSKRSAIHLLTTSDPEVHEVDLSAAVHGQLPSNHDQMDIFGDGSMDFVDRDEMGADLASTADDIDDATSLQDLLELPQSSDAIADCDASSCTSDELDAESSSDEFDAGLGQNVEDAEHSAMQCDAQDKANGISNGWNLPPPPNNWHPFPNAEVTKLTYWFLKPPRIPSRRMSQLLHILREPGFQVSNLPKSFKTFRKYTSRIPRATVHYDTVPVTAVTRKKTASGEHEEVKTMANQVPFS